MTSPHGKRSIFQSYLHILKGHWLALIGIGLVGIVLNGVFAAADPMLMKLIIDEGLMSRDFRTFGMLAVVVVVFSVLVRLGLWAYELAAQRLRNRMTKSLSMRMLSVFHALPYDNVRRHDNAYFVSRVYDEPSQVAQAIVGNIIGFFVQAVTLVVSAAIVLYLNWRIAMGLSLAVPLLMHFARRFAPQIQHVASAEKEYEAQLREGLGRVIAAYPTTRIFGLEETSARTIRERLASYLRKLYERVEKSTTYTTVSTTSMSLAEAAVLLVAGYEVIAGRLSIGGLLAFMKAFWKVIGAFGGLVNQLPALAKLNGYVHRIREFEQQADWGASATGDGGHAVGETATTTPAAARASGLALSGVGIERGGRQILHALDLSIEAPSRTLIVGPNGAGKSTLAYLLTGLLSPDSGRAEGVGVDGTSAQLTPAAFIPSTLKDNVRWHELTAEKRALFDRLVEDFGLVEQVEQDIALSFSEGEKKKAQILMALLQDADAYLFDEPLANIDAESKELVMSRIFEVTSGKILIVILHGDEHLHDRFDRIVDLERLTPGSEVDDGGLGSPMGPRAA